MDEIGIYCISKIDFRDKFFESCGQSFIQYFSKLSDKNFHKKKKKCSLETLNGIHTSDEEDTTYLKSLDPKEWKSQDHYAVLGLKQKRYSASFAEIKAAYRHKVLKHHPDKRKGKNEKINSDDDYFTCITKSWEILGEYNRRRSYDSVDPYFDNEVPTNTEYNKTHFFEVFGDVFERNSRWSERKPVPLLGGPNDAREEVDKFYKFWYNFESWREYSYEDEESKERAQDREERKWIEKQNKAVRAKKKKEEMARIRSLVDTAYSMDPRILKFKMEDKEKKEAQKKAKAEAIRLRQEELEKAQQEEKEKQRKLKEETEAAERAKQNALKAERELQKRLIRKEKKVLRDFCKDNNYFTLCPAERVTNMQCIEKVCDTFELKELECFNEELKKEGKEAFYRKLKEMENKLEKERQLYSNSTNEKQDINNFHQNNKQWSPSHINLLIKAVNLFPAGTSQRWEVVANFINQHSKNGSCMLSAKDVLSKAKDLQSNDDSKIQLRRAANARAYEIIHNDKKLTNGIEETKKSERFDSVAEQLGFSQPWTGDEQKLLEQALKTYPSNTADRWDNIASCIPSRTKKECMKRYKELVEMVRAKKAVEKITKVK